MMDKQITQFFDAYADHYKNGQYNELINKLCIPFTFLSDEGPMVLPDRASLSENFEQLISRYQALGIEVYQFNIRQLQPLSSTVTLAKLDWRFLNSEGHELYNSSTSYFLLRENDQSKIMSILLHDEQAKLKETLQQICKQQAAD